MNERSQEEAIEPRNRKHLLRQDGTEGDLLLGAPRPPTPKSLVYDAAVWFERLDGCNAAPRGPRPETAGAPRGATSRARAQEEKGPAGRGGGGGRLVGRQGAQGPRGLSDSALRPVLGWRDG